MGGKRKVGAYEVDDSPGQPSLVSGLAPRGLAATGTNRIQGKGEGKGYGQGKAGSALGAGFAAALAAVNLAVGFMGATGSGATSEGAFGSAGSGVAGSASGCAVAASGGAAGSASQLRHREVQLARWAGSRVAGSASGSAGWSPAQAAAAGGSGGGGGGGGGYNWRANPAFGAITWDPKIQHAFWQLNKNGHMRRYSIHKGRRRRRCRSISDSDTGSSATEPD